ncbi:MAG: cytochrome c biogenesis protein CcsA [Myxococcota bacterium]
MGGVLFIVAALAYTAACGLFTSALTRGTAGLKRGARWALVGAVLLHAAYLVVDMLDTSTPAMGRVHQTLTVLSLGTTVAFLLASIRREAITVLGAFITPVALFFFMGSGLGRSVEHVSDEVRSLLVPLHIGVNVLGLVAFALAFGAAIAYVIQERQLRQKRLGGIFQRLPALDVLDRFGLRAVSVGFPLLTIGIITGAFWAFRIRPGAPMISAAHAFALVAWVLFAGVLLLRVAAGWRGRRAAIGTIVGFLCTAAVLVGYVMRITGSAS